LRIFDGGPDRWAALAAPARVDEFRRERRSYLQNPTTRRMTMTETTSTATRITQLGTVMIPVSDQDRALEFYVGKLGFEKRADTPFGNGDRWVEVAPHGAETSLALCLPREGEPVGIESRVGFASDDVDADHASLKAQGVDVDETVMRMGDPVPPMFFFRDVDGNNLLIVQRP
jgi:catechol 2,3-dioxygenase-like lactoylglutathione lyase family enzyme